MFDSPGFWPSPGILRPVLPPPSPHQDSQHPTFHLASLGPGAQPQPSISGVRALLFLLTAFGSF